MLSSLVESAIGTGKLHTETPTYIDRRFIIQKTKKRVIQTTCLLFCPQNYFFVLILFNCIDFALLKNIIKSGYLTEMNLIYLKFIAGKFDKMGAQVRDL